MSTGGEGSGGEGSTARAELLARIVDDVARHGIGGRSLRDIAAGAGTSHRIVLYHFGSRQGLVAAIVEAVEADQRRLLRDLAGQVDGPGELVRALWRQVSSPEVRPFVRLFFETVGAVGAEGGELTRPWLDDSVEVTELVGVPFDPVDIRLGVAVTRGLLVDVVVTGEVGPATEALERYVALLGW